MSKKSYKIIGLIFLVLMLFSVMAAASATCNVIVITDPTGEDPNGAAAGSMSFANNMFQSSFIMSKNDGYAMLSGGEGNGTERNYAIIDALGAMQHGSSPAAAAALASGFDGIRLVIGGPSMGAAIGGDYNAYLVVVDNDGTVRITHHEGGVVQLPQGSKGAIIHLRNSQGNPKMGTADRVRRETAVNIGKMIRDGYPATYIVGKAMDEVARDSGEKYHIAIDPLYGSKSKNGTAMIGYLGCGLMSSSAKDSISIHFSNHSNDTQYLTPHYSSVTIQRDDVIIIAYLLSNARNCGSVEKNLFTSTGLERYKNNGYRLP